MFMNIVIEHGREAPRKPFFFLVEYFFKPAKKLFFFIQPPLTLSFLHYIMFTQSSTAQSSGTFSLRGSDTTGAINMESAPAVLASKPLFNKVDTSINNSPFSVRSSTVTTNNNNNNSNNTMLFSSASTTSATINNNNASIPLQPTLNNQEPFNFGLDTTTRSTPTTTGFRTLWTQPPSFFKTSSNSSNSSQSHSFQDIIDMDMDPITSETTSNVAFGEGRSLLRFSINPEGKLAGRKRENTIQNNERRVSFKRTSIDEGKGKSRAEDGIQDTDALESEEAESIYVFGFPVNTEQKIIDHFSTYGEIVKHEKSPTGNWMTIRYSKPEFAQNALKSNDVVITGDHFIGVTRGTNKKSLAEQAAAEAAQAEVKKNVARVIPFEEAKDLYKKPGGNKKPDSTAATTTSSDGLGSGKAGLSVLNIPTVNPRGDIKLIKDNSLLSKVKDFLFEW
ncbi:hypothetical protein BDA99DRAFT_509078 [Phascolomyces articulosus]|uniref:RRM Nup35-type domain-containing protein n=1 Tax=Phascolomyces articulosus TaxID=60185 RepID=A0AAD5PEN6_9FUNG|nr:hypothetical protein BDA99DRAFT_509078 [Phascolomyces articulosus]